MIKKTIKINESTLRKIIAENVKKFLRENIETNGFLDCISKLNFQRGGTNGNQRIINGKVYSYSLSQWKDAYDNLCDKKGGHITVDEYMNWLDKNCLITDANAKDSINQYSNYKSELDKEREEKQRTAEIVRNNRAAFENACDYLYFGYGFNRWFKSCEGYISEEDAKVVWKAAFDKRANED